MTLFGTIYKTLFFSEENGAIIFLLKVSAVGSSSEKTGRFVTVKGTFAVNQKGFPITVTGEMEASEYGDTLKASEIREVSLKIPEAKAYLSGLGKGLKETTIDTVAKRTKGKLFQFSKSVKRIEELLPEVRGDEESVIKAFEMIREQQERIALFLFLSKHGGNLAASNKLYDTFPENTLANLLKDPYGMVQQARIPITIGDSIAIESGVQPMCRQRVTALVDHAMTRLENDGHTCVPLDVLFKTVDRLAQKAPISKPDLASSIGNVSNVVRDDTYNVYYKKYLLADERQTAMYIKTLQDSAITIPWHPEYIEFIEKENGVAFGAQQRMAFSLLKSTGIKILTGGPGTGKTTTVNGLLKYLEMVAESDKELQGLKNMALSAPSGRASQRMAEATGRPASTCHRMIEYAPYGACETYRDEMSPMEANVIVIDEVSMLDISLAKKILGACKKGSLVLFVGDINQLQSVGPGSVLQDMIRSQCIQVVQLTEVYRQRGGSPIPTNAQKIIEGNTALEPSHDFQMIQVAKGQAVNEAVSLTKELLNKLGDAEQIQLLAPAKRGDGGTRSLNTALQPLLNFKHGEGLKFGNKIFHEEDRVIMLSNNYRIGYFNGDVGHIKSLTKQSMEVELISDTVKIERKDFDDVELAYACTIHKSQGSEYPHCIIVLPADKKFMMDQSVLYTAVTRAKKGVYIIYEDDALTCSIKRRRQGSRKGFLQQRLEEAIREQS